MPTHRQYTNKQVNIYVTKHAFIINCFSSKLSN